MGENADSILYAYYQRYTSVGGVMPCMMAISDEKITYRFSVNEANGIWDNEQWSKSYLFDEVPIIFRTKEFLHMKEYVEKMWLRIIKTLEEV